MGKDEKKELGVKKRFPIKQASIWIIAILLISTYFVHTYLKNRVNTANRKVEKAKMQRIVKTRKIAVTQLVKRTNAVHNWEKKLSKRKHFRLEPILTIELERLWLTDRPILFIGFIKDISTMNQDNYKIKIERSLFYNFKYIFSTKLQLVIQCPKYKVDLFLKNHPNLFKDFGSNGVAVVASINKIETTTVSGEKGDIEEVKIGKGKCIDMLYTGDIQF
jgi:hypothetical protein